MASDNYNRVSVEVTEWGPESEVDDPRNEFRGDLEEMYVDDGKIWINIDNPDDEVLTNIVIPIQAKKSWNGFVDSLPAWDN